jgi:nicotinamide-nucleotide amidase
MNSLKTIKAVEVIHVGDELLLGLRVNTHLEYLARKFTQYGAVLMRDQVVRDVGEEIQEALRHAWNNCDMVVVTGGLGPTVDDLTREAVAEFLKRKLVYNTDVERQMRERFAKYGYTFTENNLQQCYHPEGSSVLPNPNGTAPGIWIEVEEKIVVLLPGPPRELIPMVEDQVIARLLADGRLKPQEGYVQIRSCGVGESMLASKIDEVLGPDTQVSAAYCVHSGVVDVRFSAPVGMLDQAREAAEWVAAALGEDFVGYGEMNHAERILERLQIDGHSLAVAESCTGGQIAAALTEVPGASTVFKGGIIAYSNAAKTALLGVAEDTIAEHHEVSAEVACEMAKGVSQTMGTTWSISSTGFAGPGGGHGEDGVGTVYIAIHSPAGTHCKRFSISGERATVIQRATIFALDTLRRKLLR